MRSDRGRESLIALVDLVAALVAGALWYVRPELGPLPLLLLPAGLAVRHLSDPPVEYELTALDAAVALFLATAGIGLLIAYNWNVALEKFYVIVGGVGIYGALVRVPWEIEFRGRTVRPANLLLGVLPAAIAAYYVATADYSLQIGKLPFLDGVFQWISSWQPSLPGHKLHPNVAGGLIAALLPLQVLALAELAGAESALSRPAARGGVGVAGSLSAAEARAGRGGSGARDIPPLPAWGGSDGAPQTASAAGPARPAGPAGPVYRLGWRGPGIETVLVVISLLGLLLSASRGAWGSLVLVAAVWAVVSRIWPAQARRAGGKAAAGATGLVVVLVIVLVLAAVLVTAPAVAGQSAGGAVNGRTELLRDSLALAWDTPFTGIGLGGFQMAFSTYILLLHVGHTFHSHNLFLNVWLEQGLLGLVALVWLLAAAVVAWLRVRRLGTAQGRAWAAAALAAIAVIAVHGMVDDAFYGSRGVLLLFVPFALLTRVQGDAVWSAYEPPTLTQVLASRNGFIAAAVLAILLLLGLTPPVRSQFQANLGALSQTRAELSIYEWPAWPIQDALRRDAGPGLAAPVDLGPATGHYEAALAIDPRNAVASRRLGQIALSRGDYPTATTLLTAAYYNGYTNRAARQLYGEILAIAGRTDEAAAVWRTVDVSAGQLETRAWWYDSIGEAEKAAAVRAAEE